VRQEFQEREQRMRKLAEDYAVIEATMDKLKIISVAIGQQHLIDGQQPHIEIIKNALDSALREWAKVYQQLVDRGVVPPPKEIRRTGMIAGEDMPVRMG